MEIECRFLEINKDALLKKLLELGAKDLGEQMLEETIIYDAEGTWKDENRFIRLRKSGETTTLSYKEHRAHTVDGTHEIELEINDYQKGQELFEKIGFVAYRHQQKMRHTFILEDAMLDIDTWPNVPAYLEIEAASEDALKEITKKIGYDWSDAIFNNAAWVLEEKYNIPIRKLRWFTFDRVE